MNRYFSKLAKRTGIAARSAENRRHQSARENIHSAFEPQKTASITRGRLEAHVEKIAAPTLSQQNSGTESSRAKDSRLGPQSPIEKDAVTTEKKPGPEESERTVKEHDPSQSLKTDVQKKESDHGSTEGRPNIFEITVAAHVPQVGNVKREDRQVGSQGHEVSAVSTGGKNDGADNVMLIDKRQHIASSDEQKPRQNQIDKRELTPGEKIPGSERYPKSEEETRERKRVLLESESRQLRESGDAFPAEPVQRPRGNETPGTPSATMEASEQTRTHGGIRAIHIVSEKVRSAETKVEKIESPAHDNSLDIHIGTISFEVHQAPEKKIISEPPQSAPRPVVIPQMQAPKMPRISRYYLRAP
ncbi:MAG: hypothetical protein GY799_20580 [Desulfobulbaceae bacterium]|nr:hypothetical protein [Desulfobulbaceae bacterium]